MKFCPQCSHELTSAQVDGKTRLKCPSTSCDYVYWNNPTPVVAAIVELDGLVVLARNKKWANKKMFGLVAGFLEEGETPQDGTLREVREELGLEGEIAGFVGYYSFFHMNQLILAFHVLARGEISLGAELAEAKLVHPDKLRPWPIGTGPAVRDWLEARKLQA
jgi:NADH pyrophosphatase NudC (nudix superfamily)